MGSDLNETTLGAVVEEGGGLIQTGPFGSQLHASDYKLDGVPVIMPLNISADRVDVSDIARISREDADRLSKHLVESGDIVYSRRGDVTRKALITDGEVGMFCGTGCLLVRPGKCIDPKFLKYHLSSPRNVEWIKRHAVGATMPNLNTGILANVPLIVPPPSIQKAIAHILGTLDDKIELNRRMNVTLEGMAQALFKSWFVDFDPVIDNALAAGNPIPAELADRAEVRRAALADGTANREAAKPFPAAFQQTEELGWIPEGWEVKQWGELAKLLYGKSLKGYRESAGSIPVFGTNGPIGFTEKALCDRAGIIIGRKGAYRGVHYSAVPFNVIDTAFYLDPVDSFSDKWAYYEILRFDINGMDSGSAIPSTSRDDFYSLTSTLPERPLQNEFDRVVCSIYDKKTANVEMNKGLVKLRDTLLPKLISGELRIQDAEKLAEKALV